MTQNIVAPSTRPLDELTAKLEGWLAARMPNASAIRVLNPAYPSGAGQSHETILFDAEWTEHGAPVAKGFVVRIKPTGFQIYPDDLFTEQYRVMDVLHRHGLRIARPFWFEDDPSILGAPFFVMEKVHGRVAVSIPPYRETGWVAEATPDQRQRLWRNAVHALASTQSVPVSELQFLAGPPHARDGLEQEWDKFDRFVEWNSQNGRSPALDASRERLRASWPANRPEGLVWGDSRIGNLMFDDDFDVVAIMDWEQPSLGGALNDLGWWLALSQSMHGATDTLPHLEGMGTRADTIALWEELTGKSADGVEWYEDFARHKHCCLNIRMTALRGRPPVDEAWLAKRLKVA